MHSLYISNLHQPVRPVDCEGKFAFLVAFISSLNFFLHPRKFSVVIVVPKNLAYNKYWPQIKPFFITHVAYSNKFSQQLSLWLEKKGKSFAQHDHSKFSTNLVELINHRTCGFGYVEPFTE